MTDTAIAETTTTTPTPPLPPLPEAFLNPRQLVARRAEIVKLASERAQRAATAARTRLQNAETVAAARVQDLRKSTSTAFTATVARISDAPMTARVRSAASKGRVRAAEALQALAKRIDPSAPAHVDPAAAKPE